MWTDEQQPAFDELHTLITTTPILSIPNPNKPICLEADTFTYTIAAILSKDKMVSGD
jgi:hypothetical protein